MPSASPPWVRLAVLHSGRRSAMSCNADRPVAVQLGRPAVWRARPSITLNRHISFDDVKRLNALRDLNGNWGCRLLRGLLYKLHKHGD